MVDVFEQIVAIVFVLLCLAGHDGEADCEHCLPLNHETLLDGLSFVFGHLDMAQLGECAAGHHFYVSLGIGQKLGLVFVEGHLHIF